MNCVFAAPAIQDLSIEELFLVSAAAPSVTSSLGYDIGYAFGRLKAYFADLPGGVEVWQGD